MKMKVFDGTRTKLWKKAGEKFKKEEFDGTRTKL